MRIETWKKIMFGFGVITQTLGYFMDSSFLIVFGLIASPLGIISIAFVK